MSAQIKWILFDLDNTLLDFSSASKAAFRQTFQDHGLTDSDQHYQVYSTINGQLWSDFEQNKVTAQQIRGLRFARLFEHLQITDQSGLNFNAAYLKNMIKQSKAYPGVVPLLEKLQQTYRMSIVTNGLKEVQRARIDRLKMTAYFESIIVSDEIGHSKPDRTFFDHVFASVKHPPALEETLIVGDSLSSDIKGGIQYGIQTCWISHGKTNHSEHLPDYSIASVDAINQFLYS